MRSRPSPHLAGPDDLTRAAALADAASQALVLATSAANDNSGVSAAQLRVLGVVDQAGSVNLTQLAVALHTAPSSASRLCDRLEAAVAQAGERATARDGDFVKKRQEEARFA